MTIDSDVPRLYAELLNTAHYTFDSLSLLHFGAALLLGVTGILTVRWERGSRVSHVFAIFCFLVQLWCAGRGLVRLLNDPDLVLFVSRRVYVLIILAVALLYQFSTIMVRTEKRRINLIRVSWGIAIYLALACFTSTSVVEGVERFSWGYEPTHGRLGYVLMAWVSALMALAALDTYRAWRDSPRDRVEHRRIALFALALLIVFASFVDFLPTVGIPVYPLAFVPISLFALITAYLTFRYGLVEVTPELAAKEMADHVRGALLMLDHEGVVQYANQQSAAVLGVPAQRLVGASARSILGEGFDPPRLSALARAEERAADKEWTHVKPSGEARDLVMSVFAVKDPHAREVAYVCQIRDITEQKRLELERRGAALRDTLTGLPNRTLFLGLLDAAIERRRSDPTRNYAVCFVALSRMRVINEDLGFAAGDRVLVEVVRRLRLQARQDTVARVGGDEFAILVRGTSRREEMLAYVEQLLRAIKAPLLLDDHALHLSAAIGVATSEHSYSSGADVLRDASIAMYRAKELPGGVEFIGAGGVAERRTRLEAELRTAIRDGQLRVFYQPVLDLQRQDVSGFEALVRWQHPARGIVKPEEFLSLAEDVGLLAEIDCFVHERACADLSEFQRRTGNPALSVSVNLSEDCLSLPDIEPRVMEAVRHNRLEPAALRIELLERVVQLERVQEPLRRLRAQGVGLYIDDFGTGYSALSRLHQAPLTAVKIDRTFVNAMSQGEGNEKVIRAILSLGSNLGLDVIAEGASTAEEVRRLQEFGCRMVQGFFFSEALPFDAALAWVMHSEELLRRFAILSSRRLDLRRA